MKKCAGFLKVSRSSYYRWLSNGPSKRSVEYGLFTDLVKEKTDKTKPLEFRDWNLELSAKLKTKQQTLPFLPFDCAQGRLRQKSANKLNILIEKEFPEALPRGFPLKMSFPNLFRGLNNRVSVPELIRDETSEIPLRLCLEDSSFQEILYFSSNNV